jgi:hypothetical protein
MTRTTVFRALRWRPLVVVIVELVHVFGSLARKIRRRPDVPAGATALQYGGSMRPLLWCMIIVSIIEVAVVELITISAEMLASARKNVSGGHRHTVEHTDDELAVSVMGYTDVAVELTEPYVIDLGRKGTTEVSRVRFQTDDPAGAVALINEIVAARTALPRG